MIWDRNFRERRMEFYGIFFPLMNSIFKISKILLDDSRKAETLVNDTYLRAYSSYSENHSSVREHHLRFYKIFSDSYRRMQEKEGHKESGWAGGNIAGIGEKPGADTEWREIFPDKIHDNVKDSNEKVLKAIKGMPPELKLPYLLLVVGNFRYSELAEILGIAHKDVSKLLSRAHEKLQNNFLNIAASQEISKI